MRGKARNARRHRNLRLRGLAALCALGLALSAVALDIREKTQLEFGGIATGPSSGPVTLAPTGGVSCGVHTCLGGAAPSKIHIKKGERNSQYSISYSTGDLLLQSGGSGTIPLQNLNDSAGGLLVTNGGGNAKFDIGGEIVVGPATPGGDYGGTYTIILELQ